MSSILITGSEGGLGRMAARELIKQGHQVLLHARNESRANDALSKVPGAETALIADLSAIGEKKMADKINALGRFDHP